MKIKLNDMAVSGEVKGGAVIFAVRTLDEEAVILDLNYMPAGDELALASDGLCSM